MRLVVLLALVSVVGCSPAAPVQRPPRDHDPAPTPSGPTCPKVGAAVELVESTPVETTLPVSRLPDTQQMWVRMIDGARRSLDIEQFYFASRPAGSLEPVIQALERAAERGVALRLLADAGFANEYPATLARLEQRASVRRIDMRDHMGGVQHAKYFIVDGCDLYLGSANFDWRSLQHIHELGLRIRSPQLVAAFAEVFAFDWQLAGGQPPLPGPSQRWDGFPITLDGELQVLPAFSPTGWLPDERSWDLPQLVATIDGAKLSVRVQLLTYSSHFRDGTPFPALDQALRRAAGRGVAVELMVSNWQQRPGRIEDLQALVATSAVAAKLVTIPEHPSGFIPFARVIHAKAMIVDSRQSWIGTSNWSGDYFHKSRNVGVLVTGERLARPLEAIFRKLWQSPYATAVDPEADYPEPRIGP